MPNNKLKWWILSSTLIISSVFIFSFRDSPYFKTPIDDCSIQNVSVGSAEELVYKAYYNLGVLWMPAGEATFSIKENRYDYEVTVIGKTYESYNSFFRVNDYFYSKISKKTMYQINFVIKVEEGDYRKFDSLSFQQNTQKVISFNGKTKATATITEVELGECMHDLLSVLYFMRNINVDAHKPGDYIPTKMYFDNEIYPIKVRYDGKEKNKKIKSLGTFNTLKVVPDLISGTVFKENDKMKVWVSDDQNKLPLLIESPLAVGSAKAVLKSYKNLRHDLSAKLK